MKRLLIVRLDAIGDFIIFSAVLQEYARIYSEYQIDLLCSPSVKELIEAMPFVSKKMHLDICNRLTFDNLATLIKLLTAKYDKIIYPAYSRTRIGDWICRLIWAKEKIAFDGDNHDRAGNSSCRRDRFFTKIVLTEEKFTPEIERNLEFIQKLEGNPDLRITSPKIWFLKEDDAKFADLKKRYNFDDNSYIVIFPGARSFIRCWPENKWKGLLEKFSHQYKEFKIVIAGQGKDYKIIDGILNNHSDYSRMLVNLYGKTPLRVFAKLIQHAKLLISTETSAIHVAACFDTPTVCIMGGGHFGRFYPYGEIENKKIAYKKMDCFRCNWQCKHGTPYCITNIEVEDVWREARLLMG